MKNHLQTLLSVMFKPEAGFHFAVNFTAVTGTCILHPAIVIFILALLGGLQPFDAGKCCFAQGKEESFSKLFTEAAYHIEYKNYSMALSVYLQMDSIKPDNANTKYRIGLCYLHSSAQKKKAIPYLEKAIRKTSRSYDDLSYLETNAPLDAYFQLGRSYHVSNRLDTAIGTFKVYKSLLSKKHYMQEEADHYIEMCNNAKELMKDSVNVVIENLGDSINSPYSDYAPVITADESMLIFTSRREGTTGGATDLAGDYLEDVYMSVNEFGEWRQAVSIGSSINTSDHDAAIGLSHDGQMLFIYRDDDGDGNIYQSDLMGDIWTVPEKLSPNINSTAWETHASLSTDGQMLYFVSDRKDGMGGRDVYRCKKLPNGEWALAMNLGAAINTKYDEDAPFLLADDSTLYFSSQGHKSMGGFDIFVSTLLPNEQWTQPANVGYPINTVDDDIYFVLTAAGNKGYFSTIRSNSHGDKDIYKLTIPQQQVTKLTVLRGEMEVADELGNPIETEVLVNNKITGEDRTYKPNSKTGKYLIILQPGMDYEISYMSNGLKVRSEDLMIPEESSYQLIERPLDLKKISYAGEIKEKPDSTGKAVKEKIDAKEIAAKTLKDIPPYQFNFEYNMKDIDTTLQKFKDFAALVISAINHSAKIKVLVEASASTVPSSTYKSNETLAKIRAGVTKNTFVNYLKSYGIDATALVADIDAKVQGPAYKTGSAGNKALYEKWQYVKIIPYMGK